MKRKNHLLLSMLLFFVMMISGCNYPGGVSNSEQVYPTDTSVSTAIIDTATSQEAMVEATQTAANIATSTPTVELISTPTLTPTIACIDKAEYLKDVSVPDGTSFSPGDTFVKTWRIRNVGSCTWTEQYKVVFSSGEQMNGASPVSFVKAVPQGETIDISVSMTAPSDYGSYKGEWLLQNQSGDEFGVGEEAKVPLNIQINVVEVMTGFELKQPAWEDTFKNNKYWYLIETGNTEFSLKKGHLIMKAFSTGKRDEWGLATHEPLDDFFMEATFTTGDKCEGKDRYGLLIRAKNPNSGYVFSFACNGYYRFYRWDGANYFALQEWKEATSIHSGPDQINRMGILADGDTFKLYANGELLGEYEDDTFDHGKFGLMVGSGETSNLVIYVEDIAYWLLD